MYEAALTYFNKNGTVKGIEPGHIVDGSELYNWVANEIKAVNGSGKTARTSEQLEKLKKIGIEKQPIDRFEKQWFIRYEELKAFIEEHKCLPLTRKVKDAENSIAVWLNSQRKKYREGKLSEDKARVLREIGVEQCSIHYFHMITFTGGL